MVCVSTIPISASRIPASSVRIRSRRKRADSREVALLIFDLTMPGNDASFAGPSERAKA